MTASSGAGVSRLTGWVPCATVPSSQQPPPHGYRRMGGGSRVETNTKPVHKKITISCLSNYQLSRLKGFIPTSGGCNHPILCSVEELKTWFRASSPSSLPSYLQRYFYFSILFDLAKSIEAGCSEEEVTKTLDSIPRLWADAFRSWRSDNLLPEIKKALPALVPSIKFRASRVLRQKAEGFVTNRKLVSTDPDSWSHTGIFGIDIDRGSDNNTEDADELYRIAADKLPNLPGFLFAYVSPNKGIKALFSVDSRTTELLNSPKNIQPKTEPTDTSEPAESGEAIPPEEILAERMLLHRALYHHIAEMVERETGLHPDKVCKDAARLQFLYHGKFIPAAVDCPKLFIRDLSAIRSEYLRTVGEIKPSTKSRALRPGEQLPKVIADFPDWLRLQGHHDAADGFEKMKADPDGNLYGFCPCCDKVRTGLPGDRDLMMDINPDFPLQSWFNCLHSSCHDYTKVPMPMSRLWTLYTEEIESREAYESECDANHKLREEPWASDTELMDCFRKGICPEIKERMESFSKAKYLGLNYVHRMPKSGLPIYSQANLAIMLRGLGFKVVKNMITKSPLLLDLENAQFIQPNDGILSRLKSFWENLNITRVPSTNAISTDLIGLAQDAPYHSLATLACAREWDGKDRLSIYLNTLPMDKDRLPTNGWTAEEWRDHVLTTWLITMWRRVAYGLNNNSKDLPPNFMPIFSGPQGIGKNQWVERLFSDSLGCLSENFDFNQTKDAVLQMANLVCIHVPEIDRVLCNQELNSTIKNHTTNKLNVLRPSYARFLEFMCSISSLIASTNITQPLTDPTGSRRYFMLYLADRPKKETDDAVDVMKNIDRQQLWAQIKYLSESDLPKEYTWTYLTPISEEYNNSYAVVLNVDEHILRQLRPVDDKNDMDIYGKKLKLRIPDTFSCISSLHKALIESLGGASALSQRDLTTYKQQAVTNGLIRLYGKKYAEAKQIRMGSAGVRANRIPLLFRDDWLKYASDETKARWYKEHPEWEEQDKQRQEVIVG